MSRRLVLAAAALAIAIAGVVVWRVTRRSEPHRAKVAPLRPPVAPPAKSDKVTIKGTLFDQERGVPVPSVKVVLLGPAGEVSSTTPSDGTFQFTVPPGRYRVFVRDLDWITAALQERIRLDDGPHAELAGALDAHIAPLLVAETDLDGIEITATRAAKVTGRVYDEHGNRVAGAAIRMREPPVRGPFVRPVLGTDTAITNEFGEYTLALPAGMYEIGLRHPNFAGVLATTTGINLSAGMHDDESLQAVKGCIVRGKVVTADGKPSPDGAIEVDDTGGTRFGPMARVGLDGTFELATISSGYLRVRAWPWKSAPSKAEEVYCSDGKRYDDITLKLEAHAPDLSGTLVDAQGQPVPFTHVDLQPIDPNMNGQQERTDARGEWHVYDVEPGNYRLVASAEGRGVADLNVLSPKQDIQLQLAGTGRIAGTTTQLVDGAIQVSFLQCGNDTTGIDVPPETQIVPVHGGRFTIDGAPACTLRLHARWRNRTTEATAIVEPNATAYVTLDLGEAKEKAVHGVVIGPDGAPAANVPVTALVDQREAATVRTDKDGHFTMTTRSGAQLLARGSGKIGRALVGKANVPSEQVDITLDSDLTEP